MKITSVEPQKKNPHRFNIFLDGQFAFGADEDLVVEQRLIAGKQLDNSELEVILFETEVGKLMERMYRLFSIRQRSEKEVRDYFRIKNYELRIKGKEEYSDLVVESLINKLKQKDMINDEQFTRDWVEARRKSKHKSKIALKQELFQKGINREIIEAVINHQSSVISEEQIAEQALERKVKTWKDLEPLEFKKKAYDFLLRRGFGYSIVQGVVAKLLQNKYNQSGN